MSFIRCPLDGAHIVHYSGDPHTVNECPACQKYFEGNEDSVVRYVDKSFKWVINKNINKLKEKLNYLEKILDLAENPNNEIKKANMNHEAYNQANLSAEGKKARR